MRPLGRADLLRVLLDDGPWALTNLAAQMGLEARVTSGDERMELAQREAVVPKPPFAEGPIPAIGERTWAPIPLQRVLARQRHEDVEAFDSGAVPIEAKELKPKKVEPPAPDAVPWARLWKRLESSLEVSVAPRRPPIHSVLDAFAKLRIQDLQRCRRERRGPKDLVLVLDRDDRLAPLWPDQGRIAARLARCLGRDGLEIETRIAGAESPVMDRRGRKVSPGAPTLFLSGWGRPEQAERVVQSFLRKETLRGLRGRPLVLLGAGEGGQRATSAPVCVMGWESEAPAPLSQRLLARWLLLRLLAIPIFIEPGLLRSLRLALPMAGADLGVELDVWAALKSMNADSGTMDPERRSQSLTELTQLLSNDPVELARLRQEQELLRPLRLQEIQRLRDDAQSAANALHEILGLWRQAASPAALHEEHLTLDVCFPQDSPRSPVLPQQIDDARSYLERVGATRKGRSSQALRGWLKRFQDRSLPDLRFGHRHSFVKKAFDEAESGAEQRWHLRQLGGEVMAAVRQAIPPQSAGAPLCEVSLRHPRISVGRQQKRLRNGHGSVILKSLVPSTTLSTDRETLKLEAFDPKIVRASAWGSGRQGLWVEVGERSERLRFHWHSPEEPDEPGGKTEGHYELDASTLPSWAADAGIDEHGAWADVSVKGVVMRMRWIPPGEFVMGSPEEEVGRFDNETQHEVTISAGYWMADAPCTQAFYKAVVRKNPSSHKEPDAPVERVSWDDAVSMIDRLNVALPGFDAQLPTEAQWEYACRAGTTTATYAGDLQDETTDPVLDPIAWYRANSEGSVQSVKKKLPNEWGLYDMLGNVYEWCQDTSSSYPEGPQLDPLDESAPAERVLRGGNCYANARYCRAAFRFARDPGSRYDWFGFRLSRGQVFVSSRGGAPSQEAEPETGRDAPRRRSWPWSRKKGKS